MHIIRTIYMYIIAIFEYEFYIEEFTGYAVKMNILLGIVIAHVISMAKFLNSTVSC